jgi:hypothetical protein
LGKPDGEIDGRVVRHVEEQELGRPDEKRRLKAWSFPRQAAVETLVEHVAQRAEAAQGGSDDLACQCSVALGQSRKFRRHLRAGKHFIERAPATQNAVEKVCNHAPGRQASRFAVLYSFGH